jgi:exodeoxyribonuclease VII large subunit
MAKPLKSKWEFGELFPIQETRKTFTVSELTGNIRRILEKEIGRVLVTGEISNLRVQSSGHVYFAIKDAGAQLSCVLFRSEAQAVNRAYLQDGQKVILEGELTVYDPRGQYQLRVASVELQGLGALQAAFDRLKQKLQAEGLFDPGCKREIPPFPKVIGLVTSPTGAAIRDVLHTIQRRNPALRIVLASCRVQGPEAAREIAASIHSLNEWSKQNERSRLDLIVLTRGGGSLEDLWAFNEEIVARAIHGSELPVLSAIGHEIDFTISDFVADFRAATPTAAAEIITEGVFSVRERLESLPDILRRAMSRQINQKRDCLTGLVRLLSRGHPKKKIARQMQRLDEIQSSIGRCLRHHLHRKVNAARSTMARLERFHPRAALQLRTEHFLDLNQRLRTEARFNVSARRQKIDSAETRLRLLSPSHILERGYSITLDSCTGKVIHAPGQVGAGAKIISKLKSGELRSVVQK